MQPTCNGNKAFDGYAIYIEGFEDAKTNFVIRNNEFIDNYDESNLNQNKSLIASEVYYLYQGLVIKSNIFRNNNQNYHVESLHYIDQYGILIAATPTPSNHFSQSSPFTKSSPFTLSSTFTQSSPFKPTSAKIEFSNFININSHLDGGAIHV